MVASAESARSAPDPLHAGFLATLPRVELHAAIFFRDVRCPQQRDDCVAETVAVAWMGYRSLARRGKDAGRSPAARASLAARHVKAGRRLCGQEPAKDALSPLAQARHGFAVQALPVYSTLSANPLTDALIDNTRSPVDEQVCCRLDFPTWLGGLGERNRRLAEDMALGHRTRDLARAYGVCPSRVSQLRREFCRDWLAFCAELPDRQP